jgi:chromosome segregation ATPase
LIEEDLDKTEERLNTATTKLNEASQAADESERGRKLLESKGFADDERIQTLEKTLAEAQIIAEDADRRYDEVSRRIAIMEVDLERTEDRAEAAENKTLELEEELKVVGNNMKSLEVSEQEAIQREESYEEQIRDISARLKDAEQRADLAERTMAKLQKEVDRLEDELASERVKTKGLQSEMEKCMSDLQSM